MTITMRNLLGGLFGGMAGILLSHYLHPMAMPVGVFVGVAIGWWNAEIWQAAVIAHHRACATVGGGVQVAGDAVAWFGRVFRLPGVLVRFLRFTVANVVVGSIVWTVTAPSRFYRWHTATLANRSMTIEVVSYFVWVAVSACIGVYLFWDVAMGKNGTSGGAPAFGFILGAIVSLGGIISALYYYEETDADKTRARNRQKDILSRYGALALFGHFMIRSTLYSVGCSVFVAVSVSWLFSSFALFLCGVYPTLLILGTTRGSYHLVSRTGHGLCFGVTLAVTGLSWLYFRGQFENEVVVWSIALLTGVTSGAVTELVRIPLLAFFSNTKAGRWMAAPVGSHIMGDSKMDHPADDSTTYVGRGQQVATLWFRDTWAARLLRTACFGTSINRQIKPMDAAA